MCGTLSPGEKQRRSPVPRRSLKKVDDAKNSRTDEAKRVLKSRNRQKYLAIRKNINST